MLRKLLGLIKLVDVKFGQQFKTKAPALLTTTWCSLLCFLLYGCCAISWLKNEHLEHGALERLVMPKQITGYISLLLDTAYYLTFAFKATTHVQNNV